MYKPKRAPDLQAALRVQCIVKYRSCDATEIPNESSKLFLIGHTFHIEEKGKTVVSIAQVRWEGRCPHVVNILCTYGFFVLI